MSIVKKPLFLAAVAVFIGALLYDGYGISSHGAGAEASARGELSQVSGAQSAIVCAPDDQNCDPRTQASRTMAYRALRDRHAEHD